MKKTATKTLALLLVLVQLFALLPVMQLQANAVDDPAQPTAVTETSAVAMAEVPLPTLNPVIEGTVRFGSFNYTGDKGTDAAGDERDGVDYVSTFYYSDDYFSRSAVNPNATAKTMEWTALEDLSMATLSKDFTIAVYGSSENTFPTVWANKDKNGKRFLTECGFTNLFTNAEFNQQTGKDTLGYMFGSKQITVYDQKTQQNKTFTLVAVGVRGAGYGAEWASNLTIGDSSGNAARDKSYSGTYRHKGFDAGAQKVLTDLRTYTANITGPVKYWVVGYSRSGAIANLVAGDITKNAAEWKTSIDDVYGYTFEAAAGALKSEDPNGTVYPNIHNIINPMDAVPRVSPGIFNHCRLGVDYRLPFHSNTTSANNTMYYNNMRAVLPMVAKIADIYNRTYTGRENDKYEDSVITDSDPATYPYNDTIQIKKFGITNFSNGFVEDVSDSSSVIAPSSGLYLDTFLDNFVDAFLKCIAWDYEYFYIVDHFLYSDYMTDHMTKDPMSHEQQYVKNYQEALRTLAYHALKQPGMGLGALDGIMDNAMNAFDFGTIWNGAGIAVHYGEMSAGIRYNRAVYKMIDPMTTIVNNVIDETGLFASADLPEVHAAVKTIMPVLTWLYCEDHSKMNGEYLGTVFANVSTILVTHIPEMGVSWLMSLDDVFISDYREITLPKNARVDMYVFRPGIDDAYAKQVDAEGVNLASEAQGALVATVNDGVLSDSKDARISVQENGENVIIRYPGNLDLRFDVTATSDDVSVQLADYAPANVVNAYSTADRATEAYEGYNVSNITADHIVRDAIGETNMMTPDTTQSAQNINSFSTETDIPLKAGETLQIMAWHGSNQVADSYDATYVLNKIATKTCVVDFGTMTVAENGTLKTSTASSVSGEFTQNGDNVTYQLNTKKDGNQTTYNAYSNVDTATAYGTYAEGLYYYTESITTVPASSIYYDDNLTGQTFTSDGHGYSADINDDAVSKGATAFEGGTLYFTFYGTGVDVYCTTDSESGYVSAAVFQTDDPTACSKDNRVGNAITVKNASADPDAPRYNTPTISFMNLGEADTFTLKINANAGAKFKLDGVRVYNPVEAGSAAETAQADAGEGNVVYLNLHALLLNADQGFSVLPVAGMDDEFDKTTISGVLFVDNADKLAEKTHYDADGVWHEEEFDLYATQFDAYKNNSPNNEIYLSGNQAITFQVNTAKAPAGSTIYIGLSAPETGDGTVSVPGNSSKPVTSVMDMYYGVTVPSNGLITIKNVGTSLISITNLKIPNVSEAKAFQAMPAEERDAAVRAFFAPVTEETVMLAANGGADPTAAPDASKQIWNDGMDDVQTVLKALFENLLKSLLDLFTGLGGW